MNTAEAIKSAVQSALNSIHEVENGLGWNDDSQSAIRQLEEALSALSTAEQPQPVALTDEQIQAVMFEVFDYAAIADGIEAATFERRDQQRAKMFAQDRKIRGMLRSLLSVTSQPSEAEIRAKALEEAKQVAAEMLDGCTVSKYATSKECLAARAMAEKIEDALRSLAQQEQQAPAQTGEKK